MYLERSIFRHLASRISNGVRGWCQQMMLVRTARMASAPMMEPEGLPPSSDKTIVAVPSVVHTAPKVAHWLV